MDRKIKVKLYSTEHEKLIRDKLLNLFKNCPIPDNEIFTNLWLFINRQNLSGMLFMHELYKKIIDVNGIVMELGIRWGRNLALFESFRGIYEPFNHNRKIVGFDTFKGFPSVHKKDGEMNAGALGDYAVFKDYEKYLEQILNYHEQESPISSIKKFELVKGDASVTVPRYLKNNPETIIAMAYFDMDIYKPTKKCLETIKEHMPKGGIIGFDQLNYHDFPGETLALKEVFGMNSCRLKRSPLDPLRSYIVIE